HDEEEAREAEVADHPQLVLQLAPLALPDLPPPPVRALVGQRPQVGVLVPPGSGEAGEGRADPGEGEGALPRDAPALLQPLLPALPEAGHLLAPLQAPL